MRGTTFLSIRLLALVACETATEPLAPDGAVLQSLEFTESGSYVATALPDGVLSGTTFLVVDDNGGVFGSVAHGSGTDRAVRWIVDESGDVTGSDLLGTLPAPFDRADQYVKSASTTGHVVVGYAGTNRTTAGWVWTNETMTMLPVPGTSNGRAYPPGTNHAGVSVGRRGITNEGLITGWVRGSGMPFLDGKLSRQRRFEVERSGELRRPA